MSDRFRDEIYQQPKAHVSPFVFDASVAEVFADMISRSVPGYATVLDMIGVLTRRFARPGSNALAYDLGCSLGAATLAMRHNMADDGRIIAIDNSESMVNRCQQIMARDRSPVPVEIRHGDVLETPLSPANLVVMNYTLQFVSASARDNLIERIAESLHPGGALILSEKIRFEGEQDEASLNEWHHDFKRANGYSEMEIAQKRSALENVLVRDTLSQHQSRLRRAGFAQATQWFQCFNFVSILAIR